MFTDQLRASFAPTIPGRWEGVSSSSGRDGGRGRAVTAADVVAVEVGTSNARSGSWTEAARVRHLDQKLGRVEHDAESLRFNLEQVKLYPPYPINESRRAEAIRQFNGLASEVARLEELGSASLQTLAPDASTAQAEQAVQELGALASAVHSARVGLAATVASPTDTAAGSISRAAGDELAQLDAGLTSSDAGFLRRFP